MPTYRAVKTTVQLSVADLRRTTTLNPRTQQSVAASESIKMVAQEFARGSIDGTLTETPLCTEDGTAEESHIQFLGKLRNMPFFMVQAGKNFFDLITKEKRNRRPTRVPTTEKGEGKSASIVVDGHGEQIGVGTSTYTNIEPNPKYKPPCIPHALCLTVFLSNSSFVRSQDKTTNRMELFDVKIDVYFNGELCGSRFVPRRCFSEKYSMTEHIIDPAASFKHPHRALSSDESVRRSRGYYHHVVTTKRTVEEDFASIATAAVSETKAGYNPTFLAGARNGKASCAPAAGSSPLRSVPVTSDVTSPQEKVGRMKTPAVPGPITSFHEWETPRMQNGERDFQFPTPLRPRVSILGVSRIPQFPTTQPNAAALDHDFMKPALSEDCVITYAPCGILRNVGAARGWVLSEEGVIMGARFIIGG